MSDTVLKYSAKEWRISDGCNPVVVQIDDPEFGMLEIEKFQRKYSDCEKCCVEGRILYRGKYYEIVDAFRPIVSGIEWFYFTIERAGVETDDGIKQLAAALEAQ